VEGDIITLDLSEASYSARSTARIALVTVTQGQLVFKEQYEIPLPSRLFGPSVDEVVLLEDPVAQIAGAKNGEVARGESDNPLVEEKETPSTDSLISEVADEIRSHLASWALGDTPTVVILPSTSFLQLSLDLPFTDERAIAKVLPLELNDLIPFAIEEFTLASRRPKGLANDSTIAPLIVSMIPREIVKTALLLSSRAGLEPGYMIPPTAALSGIPLLLESTEDHSTPEQATSEAPASSIAVLFSTRSYSALSCFINKTLTKEHVIPLHHGQGDDETLLRCFFAEAFQATEGKPTVLYTLGDYTIPYELPAYEVIEVESKGPWSLSQGAAAAISHLEPNQDYVNFRTGEFAYHPELRLLLEGANKLAPFLGATFALIILTLAGVFGVRSIRGSMMEHSIAETIRREVPSIAAAPGEERSVLENELRMLETQLEELGNPSNRTPVDSLADIAEYFPKGGGLTIRRIAINGDKVTIEGSAPDYSAVDKLQKEFKRRRRIFCHVKRSTTGSSREGTGSVRLFSFEIRMCTA